MTKFMRFALFTAFIVISITTTQICFAATASWIDQVGNLQNTKFIAVPEDAHTALVNAIESANKSIWMEIYHLTDPEMIQKLIEAKNRKVEVRIIYDSKSLESSKYQAVFKQLTDGHVDVIKSSSAFSITHAKTFLIDQNLLFISTMNFVEHFQNMRDFGVFTTDEKLISDFIAIFQTDLENAIRNDKNSPQTTSPSMVLSPVDSEQKIVDLIDSANKTIDSTVENISSDKVIQALKSAATRGVQVRLITPECDLNSNPVFNYPSLYNLKDSGVSNRTMPAPSSPETPYMHAKTIQIDAKIVFLGSENFSFNSLTMAREIGLVFKNKDLINDMTQAFTKDWNRSSPLSATPPTNCQGIVNSIDL